MAEGTMEDAVKLLEDELDTLRGWIKEAHLLNWPLDMVKRFEERAEVLMNEIWKFR